MLSPDTEMVEVERDGENFTFLVGGYSRTYQFEGTPEEFATACGAVLFRDVHGSELTAIRRETSRLAREGTDIGSALQRYDELMGICHSYEREAAEGVRLLLEE